MTKINYRVVVARNIKKLMDVHRMNMANVSNQAIDNGFNLHRSVVSRILKMNEPDSQSKPIAYIKSDTLEALASAFNVPVSSLFNLRGFDDHGNPKELSAKEHRKELIENFIYVVSKSRSIDINDEQWQLDTLMSILDAVELGGKEAREHAFLCAVRDYRNHGEATI